MCVPGSTAWFVQEKSKLNDEHLMFPYMSWYLFLARLGKAELISLKCFSVMEVPGIPSKAFSKEQWPYQNTLNPCKEQQGTHPEAH